MIGTRSWVHELYPRLWDDRRLRREAVDQGRAVRAAPTGNKVELGYAGEATVTSARNIVEVTRIGRAFRNRIEGGIDKAQSGMAMRD